MDIKPPWAEADDDETPADRFVSLQPPVSLIRSVDRRAAWVGLLGAAQTAGHEVSIHLREDPAVSIARGHVANEPALFTLDEVGIVATKTVKIERDTGAAPRREFVTVMLEDIAAVTVIEKVEKKS